MAAPLVVSVSPNASERDVILGCQIVVTFDQEIDAATVTEDTFSLTCPGAALPLTPGELLPSEPGREYVVGTFQFSVDGSGRSVVRFDPKTPLRPDTEYSILILGASSVLSTDAVKNVAGVAMVNSYDWTFTTGTLNLTVPPPAAPLPEELRYLDPKDIVVIPRKVQGNDLAQEIQIIFPEELDPTSVNLADILVSIEPILGDLGVVVPDNLLCTSRVEGRKIIIAITGWSG